MKRRLNFRILAALLALQALVFAPIAVAMSQCATIVTQENSGATDTTTAAPTPAPAKCPCCPQGVTTMAGCLVACHAPSTVASQFVWPALHLTPTVTAVGEQPATSHTAPPEIRPPIV